MGTAVDVGDAATDLAQSRADAAATAKAISGGAMTAPDTAPAPPLQIGRSPQIKSAKPLGPPSPMLADATPQPNDAASIPHGDLSPPPDPTPALAAVKPKAFDQTGEEVANGVMRGFAELGRAAAFTIGAPLAVGADKIHDLVSGSPEHHNAQDSLFKAVDNVANTAVDFWKPKDPSKSGLGAQVLGDAAGVAPSLMTGPLALPLLSAQAGTNSGIDSVQAGQDAKTAGILATVAVASNALGMKIPLKSPNIWKRIGSSILGNETISAGSQELAKMILKSQGFQEQADKINLADPRTLLTTLVTAIGFGLHRQSGVDPKTADKNVQDGTKVGQPPSPAGTPAAEAPPGPSGDPNATPPAPPSPSSAAADSSSGMPSATPGTPPGQVAPSSPAVGVTGSSGGPPLDAANVHPAVDLRAQIKDMNDKATPRVGTFIPTESLASLTGSKDANALSVNGTLNQARMQNRTIQLPGGELMLKTAKVAAATDARIKAGEDPKQVIADVTGASPPKPDTAVVQGQDPNGAVVTETHVDPTQAHNALQKVADQNLTPVVTSQAEAQQRRMTEVSKERNSPTQAGIMTNADGTQSAVHIVSTEDGIMKVQRLDENGDPETKVRVVDPNSVKVGTASSKADLDRTAPTEAVKPAKEEAPPTLNRDEETSPKQATIGAEPQDMSLNAHERAARREAVARERDIADGIKPDINPEPIPKNAAEVEGEAAKRDAMSDDERAAYDAANKIKTNGETADQLQARLDKEADARGKDLSTRDTPPTVEAPAPKLKAAKIETALEALPKALENHETQEAVPPGKKFAGSLADRQENASLFAKILKAAAEGSSGKTEPANIERALKAAKAAERFAEKGKEETAKGQGTGHTHVTALVEEMHKAARGLIGEARAGDDVVVKPKEAKLLKDKERQAQRDKNAAKAKAKEAVAPAPAKAAKPEKSQTELDAAAKQRTASRLMDRYIHADNEDATNVHTEIEQFLHEHMSDHYTPDEMKDVLHLIREQRLEQNPDARPGLRKMSDTIGDETHDIDTSPKALKTLGLRTGSKHMLSAMDALKAKVFDNRMATEWSRLGKNVDTTRALEPFTAKLDSGRAAGAHELLNKLIENVDTPVLKTVLQNLRARVPDMPVHFVSQIQDLHKGTALAGLDAAGLFSKNFDSIQVKATGRSPMQISKTIVHELVHAATAYEIHDNPKGQLAQALEAARQVLQQRMANKYGQENIQQHRDYFSGASTAKPEDYQRHLYGLTNTDEMVAELHVNPDFVQEIADSEKYASPSEPELKGNLFDGAKSLLSKMYNAIGRFLGIQDPKLLQHIAGLTEKTMEVQQQRTEVGKPFDFLNKNHFDFENELIKAMRTRYGANPLEISRALPALREMAHEPGPVPREGDIMRAIGDEDSTHEVGAVTRLFRQAMNSGAIDAVRAVKTSLKTVPQIFRDHRRDFGGRDDPANPLNRLQDVNASKTKIIHDMSEISRPVAKAWMKLKGDDNIKVGALLRDATMYKLDPRKTYAEQTAEGKDDPKAVARHAEFETRLKGMNPEAREVFGSALDASRNLARAERRANIDTALESFTDQPLTDAQRSLLYGAKNKAGYDELVGPGKLIDLGDNNDKLKAALSDFAGQSELSGPYAHLGRHGDYVVSAEPEGTRTFPDEAAARRFAKEVDDLSPGSKADYQFRGGEHQVDYKAQYTSFHETRADALAEAKRMQDAGFNTGTVTRKTMSREDTPLSAGTRDLVAAAESKINRSGKSAGNDALVAGLRSAFLQLAAQRSAYAGSRMARKNFAGVKPEEMRRNFADHAQSTIWHTAQLRTTFKQAAALASLRDMARDSQGGANQETMFRRGEVVAALNAHLKDEVANFGHRSALNSGLARLGFMSYLASPSHALIWMTQNFTTGIPVAGARWGYGKASSSFLSAMKLLSSPALRETTHAIFSRGGDADAVNKAIMDAVRANPRFGKWAQGDASHLQQLIDRGVLGHSYSNELHEMAQSGKSVLGVPATTVNRAFEWARLLPNMADSWNRVSTALAGLEMTGGDIRKTADFVDEVHADYSSEAKPLAFKKVGRVPGMNSVTMFKTYTQSMIHLFYGNLKSAMVGGGAPRMEAAKAAAGMIVANAMFAGVYGGAALEPLRLAVYAYHKLFDKEGEVYDLKNAIHRYLADHFGKSAGNVMAGGLPHLAGFDLSSRMGLADLFFHEPPDLFSADKDQWKNFIYNEAGPMASFLAERTTNFVGHMQKGQAFQAVSSLVPVKMYQDAVKAYELANSGKTNSLGGQMTKPSAMDAAYQLFGLKPASVADAQGKNTTRVDYKASVNTTREAIIKSYIAASGEDKAAARARIDSFNKLHPAEAIKGNDLIKLGRYKQQSESNAPTRDTTLNKMTNY